MRSLKNRSTKNEEQQDNVNMKIKNLIKRNNEKKQHVGPNLMNGLKSKDIVSKDKK